MSEKSRGATTPRRTRRGLPSLDVFRGGGRAKEEPFSKSDLPPGAPVVRRRLLQMVRRDARGLETARRVAATRPSPDRVIHDERVFDVEATRRTRPSHTEALAASDDAALAVGVATMARESRRSKSGPGNQCRDTNNDARRRVERRIGADDGGPRVIRGGRADAREDGRSSIVRQKLLSS